METGRFDKSNVRSLLLALLYEFCGSCALSYGYNLSNHNPFSRSLVYMFGFIIAYEVSGAHFNPATSLAVFLTEKKYQ